MGTGIGDVAYMSRRELNAQGVDDRSIRRAVAAGEVDRIRLGEYAEHRELSAEERQRRLILATSRHLAKTTVVSDWSAGLLHGLPVPRRHFGRVQVVRRSAARNRPGEPVFARCAVMPPEHVTTVDGVRVTSYERTVADLVDRGTPQEGLGVLDAALRAGLRTEDLPPVGRYGGKRRFAVQLADARSESFGESASRASMRLARLPEPVLQAEIRDGDGLFLARSDFLWPGAGLLGEFDGLGKYDGSLGVEPVQSILREKRRQAQLERAGWVVARWGWGLANDPFALAELLRAMLERAGRLPAPSGSWSAS